MVLNPPGKTTICQHIVAEAQRLGGTCAYVDMEHALDPSYAVRCGVDIDNLLISQPDTGEQALEITETLVRSGAVDVVVIDSVAALVPRAEIEGDMGDSPMGMQARLMSQALRKLSGAIKQTNTAVVFTNQLRQKIGVMFGNPETTTGGMALKFYASVRLDVRRIQSIKLGAEIIGSRTRVRVVKNKVAPPFRTSEFDIMYNEGISKAGDVLDLATALDIVAKRGSFFAYGDLRLGQGRENAKDFLRQNPDLMEEIEMAVRQQALSGDIPLDFAAVEESSGPEEAEVNSQSQNGFIRMVHLLRVAAFTGQLVVLALLLAGCAGRRNAQPPLSPEQVYHAPTAAVRHTPVILAAFTPTPSPPPAAPAFVPTATPACTDALTFMEDLTIPDGTQVSPGAPLDKRWKVQNSGTCNWDATYSVQLIAGPESGAPANASLYPARSGNEGVIRLQFDAPTDTGTYRIAWQAFNPQNQPFGDPFYIEFVVSTP